MHFLCIFLSNDANLFLLLGVGDIHHAAVTIRITNSFSRLFECNLNSTNEIFIIIRHLIVFTHLSNPF